MSIGDTFKHLFEDTHLEMRGSDLTIYKNWNTPNMSSAESRAIKESEQKFEFPVDTNIEKDDVVQINGSRSFWKVLDIDEEIQYGTASNLNVKVIKIDHLGNEIRINSQGKAVFNAPVYGGVQVGGQNNTQTNTVNTNSDFTKAINDLLKLVENSSLNPVQKIHTKADVQIIKDLADLGKSPEVAQLANSKLEAVKEVISMTADMTSLGMVLIPIIQAAFGG